MCQDLFVRIYISAGQNLNMWIESEDDAGERFCINDIENAGKSFQEYLEKHLPKRMHDHLELLKENTSS